MKISAIIGVLLVLAVAIHYVTLRPDSNAGLKPVSEMSQSRPGSEEVAINMTPSPQDSGAQIIDSSHENRRNDERHKRTLLLRCQLKVCIEQRWLYDPDPAPP